MVRIRKGESKTGGVTREGLEGMLLEVDGFSGEGVRKEFRGMEVRNRGYKWGCS